MIAIGTLCYVIRTAPGNERMVGRTVTVIGAAQSFSVNGGVWHRVDGEWIRTEFPRFHFFARPSSLLPIAPPSKPPLPQRKRQPIPA